MSYSYMPRLSQLSDTVGFKQANLQQFSRRSHVYAEALEYMNNLGIVIVAFLKGPNSDKIFDRVKWCFLTNLTVELCQSRDGWTVMTELSKVTLPRCGVRVNLSAMIQTLSLYIKQTHYVCSYGEPTIWKNPLIAVAKPSRTTISWREYWSCQLPVQYSLLLQL